MNEIQHLVDYTLPAYLNLPNNKNVTFILWLIKDTYHQITIVGKMDKEKLEYSANYYANNRQLITGLDWEDEAPLDNFKTDFIEGAKWHQKEIQRQSKNIMDFLDKEKELRISDIKTIDRIKWYFETYFEQFKQTIG